MQCNHLSLSINLNLIFHFTFPSEDVPLQFTLYKKFICVCPWEKVVMCKVSHPLFIKQSGHWPVTNSRHFNLSCRPAPVPAIPHSFAQFCHKFSLYIICNAPMMTMILSRFLILVGLISLAGCDGAEGSSEHLTALVYSDLSQPSASKFQAPPANFLGK